jgi:hypothetical protein
MLWFWFITLQYGIPKGAKNFCVKLGKTAAETHKMLCEAYDNEALSK